jgi:SAM-dependent methyltransferase
MGLPSAGKGRAMAGTFSFESVKRCYSTWGDTYFDDYYGAKATYPQVQVDIVRNLLRDVGARNVLDAGCGPASMLRQLTELGLELYGFDLTAEMIASGRKVFSELKLDPSRLWEGNVVDPAAYRYPGDPNVKFDAILCSGVFPHIPVEIEPKVIGNLFNAVRPGGLVVSEFRNEFFALYTLNRYSRDFMFERVIEADVLRGIAGAEREKLDKALARFEGMYRTDLPPIRKGKADEPGYDEVLSRLHNPLVIQDGFRAAGFAPIEHYFYHFHALPPMFGSEVPELFRARSIALESNPRDWRGLFMASAFVIAARRPAAGEKA